MYINIYDNNNNNNNHNNNNNNYYHYGAVPFSSVRGPQAVRSSTPSGEGFFSSPKPTAFPKPGNPPYVVKDNSHSWNAVDGAYLFARPSKTKIKWRT